MCNDDDLKSCLDNYVVWRGCCSLIVRFANRLKMVCGWLERNLLCICVRSRKNALWVEMKILRKDGTIQGKKGKDRFFAAAKTIFLFPSQRSSSCTNIFIITHHHAHLCFRDRFGWMRMAKQLNV